jgi:tungstate transport system permease protein
MHVVWELLREAVPLITHGDPTIWHVIWFTVQVAAVATAGAAIIGLPIGLTLALGRFRGRRPLQVMANMSLGAPPVLVAAVLFLLLAGGAPLGGLRLIDTQRVVFIAQIILALPYTIALSAAAVQGLPPGLLAQARLLGAGRAQLATLALREARIGIVAAIAAALGSALSEVAAVSILGGNVYGYNQTLASSTLYYVDAGRYANALAVAMVLLVVIIVLLGSVSFLQHQTGGARLRFRPVT